MSVPRDSAAVDWPALFGHPEVQALIALAIREDVGSGDITTQSIFLEPREVAARVLTRTPTVVCGLPLARRVLEHLGPVATWETLASEGQLVPANHSLCEFRTDVRVVLTAERTVLNFLMRLCGVATSAQAAVAAVPHGCRARIYDTRKTTPGWRLLEKAAVRTGGACNHRLGLFDGVLIKDNHLLAVDSLTEAVTRVRDAAGHAWPVEVEIDRDDQLEEAIQAGADIVLLDNFDETTMADMVRRAAGRVVLEASGGMTLQRIPAVARTGVDRISLGMLTHTVQPADLSLDIIR